MDDKRPRLTLTEEIANSPISSTADKFWESWYFLLKVVDCYHDPHTFRYNLNAFIQALRNITFILQSEPSKPDGYQAWYDGWRKRLSGSEVASRFLKARNIIVKQEMLAAASEVRVGIFRGRRFKLGTGGPVDPFNYSARILRLAQEHYISFMIDEEHSAIGEQLGVWRKWVVPCLGPEEVTQYCTLALKEFRILLAEAHALWGVEMDCSFELPNITAAQVLLESDVDPGLIEKWGWK